MLYPPLRSLRRVAAQLLDEQRQVRPIGLKRTRRVRWAGLSHLNGIELQGVDPVLQQVPEPQSHAELILFLRYGRQGQTVSCRLVRILPTSRFRIELSGSVRRVGQKRGVARRDLSFAPERASPRTESQLSLCVTRWRSFGHSIEAFAKHLDGPAAAGTNADLVAQTITVLVPYAVAEAVRKGHFYGQVEVIALAHPHEFAHLSRTLRLPYRCVHVSVPQ